MEIVYVYQKQRREFGRQPLFADRAPELCVDIPSDPQYAENYSERCPIPVETQAKPEMSEHDVNTESYVVANKGIHHVEGGWPKDVDCSDVEHTLRYRRKVEKDEDYVRQVRTLADTMGYCIKQNTAIDIYHEYYSDTHDDSIVAMEPPSAKTLNVYRDPNLPRRPASCVSWYPEDGNKIAVAYSVLEFQSADASGALSDAPLAASQSTASYIWDIENPSMPDQALVPASPLVCIKYNPKDPHVLVGGASSGVVAYWDTRKGAYPADSSAVDRSHRDPVHCVQWVQSKTGSEFFSTSTDGMVMWWDIRRLSEPTETLQLDIEKTSAGTGRLVGGTVLDFEATMPTKFMVGTEAGHIAICNKKAKTPADRIGHAYAAHLGPLRALQRNPFFTRTFLTTGDWTAKVWSEDVRTPLLGTRAQPYDVTDACWSPVRASVFVTGSAGGTVEAWDCMLRLRAPMLSVRVAPAAVTSLRLQEHGRLLAAAAKDGSATVLVLSDSLGRMQTSEKAGFGQMLERELKREKTLEAAAREKRLKTQQARRPASPGRGGGGLVMSGGGDAPFGAVSEGYLLSGELIEATESAFSEVTS